MIKYFNIKKRKMYVSFNGEFRRRPEQNLSGASSKLSRHEIIERAHQERLKREEQRLRYRSTLCIQSYIRSYLIRKHSKCNERQRFEKLQQEYQQNNSLDNLLCSFLFFYDKKIDYDKLVWICQHALKQSTNLFVLMQSSSIWCYRIKNLLDLCVNALEIKRNNTILLRIFDVFLTPRMNNSKNVTSIETNWNLIAKLYLYLIERGFFEKIRIFLDGISSIASNPTLVVEIINFIMQPIQNLLLVNELRYTVTVLKHFCSSLLSREFTESITELLIPNLLKINFPHECFFQFLNYNSFEINYSIYLFYTVLKLMPDMNNANTNTIQNYLKVLSCASENIRKGSKFETLGSFNIDDDDYEMFEDDNSVTSLDERILNESIFMLNDEIYVQNLLLCFDRTNEGVMDCLVQVCFNLLTREDNAVQKHKLLYMLAFKPAFLRAVWSSKENKILLEELMRGTPGIAGRTTFHLVVFCELFNLLLTTLHDDEFWEDDPVGELKTGMSMPFNLLELVSMANYLKQLAVCLIEITVSTPRVTLNTTSYARHIASEESNNLKFWQFLYKSCVKLITNLYQKDSRIQFCKENFWSKNVNFNFPTDYHRIEQVAKVFSEVQGDDKPPLTTCEARWIRVLRDLPFLTPFGSRILLFRALVGRLHHANQDPDRTPFLLGPSVSISIRRTHIYEDAYLKLQDANLRQKLRVQFVNMAGLEEAGIDGGGILREFLSELLKTCFDPNRGYFKLNRSNLLYPNPNVHRVDPDFSKHYYFIGKMLGKALYENILVELPLAEFFLTKLVSQKFDVDFHYLASLDQIMYKNMLFLKNFQGNFQDLGIDFTIVNEELGETKVDELKPNGANIAVTSSNRIEYIHLLADYKMNKQIRQQCLAFKQGLHSVLDLAYLQIFSNKELQLIISGADYEIDIQDLKEHTNYSGERTAEHPVIKTFWEIVEHFTSTQKRQLLKFVTSCSRPPLLGFKELHPSFCIQLSDAADRLPSASTCMNILKIPPISDPDILKERLLYAISQSAGFELS